MSSISLSTEGGGRATPPLEEDGEVQYDDNADAAAAAAAVPSSSSSTMASSSSSSQLQLHQQPTTTSSRTQNQQEQHHPPPFLRNRRSDCNLFDGVCINNQNQQLLLDRRYCSFCKIMKTEGGLIKNNNDATCNNNNNNFITCEICDKVFCYCSRDYCQKRHNNDAKIIHSRDCDLISRFQSKDMNVKVAALIIQQSTRRDLCVHKSYSYNNNRRNNNNNNNNNKEEINEQQQQEESNNNATASICGWKERVTYLYERVVDEYMTCYESIKSMGMSSEVDIQTHNDFYLVKPRIPLLLASLGYDSTAITELALMMDETGRCQRTKLRKNTDNLIHDLYQERNFDSQSWMSCFLLTLLLVKFRLLANYKLSFHGWSEYIKIITMMTTTTTVSSSSSSSKTVIIPKTAAEAAAVAGHEKLLKCSSSSSSSSSPYSKNKSDEDTAIEIPEDVQDLIQSYLLIPSRIEISNQQQQLIQIVRLLKRDDYLFIDDGDDDEKDGNQQHSEDNNENAILKALLLSPQSSEEYIMDETTTINPIIKYYLEDEDSQYNENGLFRFIYDAFQNIPYRKETMKDLNIKLT